MSIKHTGYLSFVSRLDGLTKSVKIGPCDTAGECRHLIDHYVRNAKPMNGEYQFRITSE